jgi:hypothetical protein
MFAELVEDFKKQTWQIQLAFFLFCAGKLLTFAVAITMWINPPVAAGLLALDGICITVCIFLCIHQMLDSIFDFAEEVLLSYTIY